MPGPGYELTQTAQLDLFEIQDYLNDQSPTAARHVLEGIIAALEDIGESPGHGHLRDDLTDRDLRFKTVFRYQIIYRPDTRPVQIIRVLHGHRDVGRMLDG